MSDPTGPADAADSDALYRRILDVCVFAPVGMAVTATEDLPELVAKGRARIEQDLSNARIVGRYVVHREWRRVSRRLEEIFGNATAQPASGGAGETPSSETDAPPAVSVPAAEPAPRAASVPDAAAEAIVGRVLADYDTLSASQVVRRLESLGPEELRAVQRYEGSTRNRRTILNRASQLLDQGPATAHSG